MKTIEFESSAGPEGQIPIPPNIARQLPAGELLHIVLHWDGVATEDAAWRAIGMNRFEAAYAPEDAVYEKLLECD